IALVARQLQPEVRLHRGADVRGPAGINAPATILVLALKDIACCLLEPLLVCRPQQGMQQNVVGFQRGIRFKFATPVAFFMLLGKEKSSRRVGRSRYPAGQVINLAETQLRCGHRSKSGGGIIHTVGSTPQSALTLAGALAMASTISGGRPKRTFSGMTSSS